MKNLLCSLAAFLAISTSIASASVHTDYDHAVTFNQFHTYSWGKVQTKNDLWADRVREDVDQQLKAAGWLRMADGGDIVLVALADSRTQQEEQTFYSGTGFLWGGAGGIATTSQYTTLQGVLVISMFDPKTKKLLWRGTATGGLSDNPDKNIGKLSKATSKMFKKFPPKP